ncbi:MAG: hypothetical protein GY835_19500 [bacterium]|nr:hypothetical protein [bacterium]
MSIRIIVAGRYQMLCESLAIALNQVQDFQATHLREWATAEWILGKSPDVLLVDLANAHEELPGLIEEVTRGGQKVLAFGFGYRNAVDASVEWASPETSLAGLVQMIRSRVAQGGKGRPQ